MLIVREGKEKSALTLFFNIMLNNTKGNSCGRLMYLHILDGRKCNPLCLDYFTLFYKNKDDNIHKSEALKL